MIDRTSRLIVIALVLLITLANGLALAAHHLDSVAMPFLVFAPPLLVLAIWGVFALSMRIYLGAAQRPDEAYRQFYGRLLVMLAVWLAALDVYFLFVVPAMGGKGMNVETYNRLLILMTGLFFAGIGNVVPKLPYQPAADGRKKWLEIGAARTYRLNRISGWLMTSVGVVLVVLGLVTPISLTWARILLVAAGIAVMAPYFVLFVRYLEDYRREIQNGQPSV
jgi:hypothetical protein